MVGTGNPIPAVYTMYCGLYSVLYSVQYQGLGKIRQTIHNFLQQVLLQHIFGNKGYAMKDIAK